MGPDLLSAQISGKIKAAVNVNKFYDGWIAVKAENAHDVRLIAAATAELWW